jgi:hypothetical protein
VAGRFLNYGVGPGEANRADDVMRVQALLNRNARFIGGALQTSGEFNAATLDAILRFQQRIMRDRFASGKVTPHGETFWRLSETQPPRLLAGALGGLIIVLGEMELEEDDFKVIGGALSCEARAVKAVQMTESGHSPFEKRGRPTILFERHLFSQFTFRKYDGHFPFISNPLPGGYSFPDFDQYDRLERAYALDQQAALKATSWGAFQILGENFSDAGHPSVESFVRAMCSSVEEQGDAFVAFIKADAVKLKALQQKDWATFARHYNGPTYKKNKYDTTLQRNYDASTE